MHTGSADSGHYYSYINIINDVIQRNKDKNLKFEEKWLEFNDSFIRDFDKN